MSSVFPRCGSAGTVIGAAGVGAVGRAPLTASFRIRTGHPATSEVEAPCDLA